MLARLKARPTIISLVVLLAVALASTAYATHYWSKTVNGVNLVAQAWVNNYCCNQWGGGASSDSSEAIAIAVENYGIERCNWTSYQRWYASDWQNNSYWAQAGGSGERFAESYCFWQHDINSDGEHLFFDSGYGISETPSTRDTIYLY